MKTNKSMYLFAAALVAGTMGMTSCSNDEMDENLAKGKTTKLAMGITIANGNSVNTKAAADDVNLGGKVANIKNVVVVPMVDDAVQHPINLPEYVSGTVTSYYKEASVLQTVNNFRVYGNLPSTANEDVNFVMPSTAAENWGAETGMDKYTKPHPLYYYVDTKTYGGYFLAKEDNAWESVSNWGSKTTVAVGENNRIKIAGVTYAVGTLAAAVLDGIKDENEKIFFDGDNYEGATQKYSWKEIKEATGTINVIGITIDGQTKEFTETFGKKGTAEVTIYDNAVTNTLATGKISFNKNKIDGANIYCVVADEDAKSVTANFRFQNKSGHKLQLNNGEVVENDGYFYMPMPLEKNASQQIFEKGKTTIINATVTDWGKGTKEPVESTDVQIGIEIEVDWVEGMSFDEEI